MFQGAVLVRLLIYFGIDIYITDHIAIDNITSTQFSIVQFVA